jgi:hypothetical protein
LLTPVFLSQSLFVLAILNEVGLIAKKNSLYEGLLSQANAEKDRYRLLSQSILNTLTPWEIVRTAFEPNYKDAKIVEPSVQKIEAKEKLIKYALYQHLLEAN